MPTSCPIPVLPPLLRIPWPWQAPLWWLIWLAFLAIIAYPIRYNYRIYRELQANADANINRRWFGVFLGAMTIGVAWTTMGVLVVMPGMMSIISWGQQQEILLSNLHCDPTSAEALTSSRLQAYSQINLYTILVVFVIYMPLIFLGMIFRDKARAAARRATSAEGASGG